MGYSTFYGVMEGKSADEAFATAIANDPAGTIAEKSSFILLKAPAGIEPRQFVFQLLADDDPRVCGRPAMVVGCVEVAENKFLFFYKDFWESEQSDGT